MAVLSTLFPGLAAAQEQPGAGFLARALAQGGRFTFGSPGFLIVEDYMDGGGPVAQAVLDSTGASKSFGSLPYPGELGIAGPGLAAGVAAGFGVEGAKLPNWPFYAGAEHPVTPSSEVADPSGQFALRAAADARTARGFAQSMFGNENGSGGGRSESSVTLAEDGTVTAVAETVDEMLFFGGGTLTVNSVRSRSVTTVTPGAEPVTETDLSFTGVAVNGQGAVFAPGDADGAAPLIEALAQAGITLEVVRAQPVAGGGTADALRITVLGGPPIPGAPQGRVIFSFGGATTSVQLGEAAAEAPAEEEATAATAAPSQRRSQMCRQPT
ncbi:MAG: hypothetical protein ACRD0O_12980 [Acidimicrobiia bacterium]